MVSDLDIWHAARRGAAAAVWPYLWEGENEAAAEAELELLAKLRWRRRHTFTIVMIVDLMASIYFWGM